ncbi:MAG: DnaJ C-terminal domain-containing protein [Collinsella sp.]
MQSELPVSRIAAARDTVVDTPCSHCGGDGRVRTHERLDVEVPAGVATGRQLRLPRIRRGAVTGAPASGDLIVTIQVDARRALRAPRLTDLLCDGAHAGIAEAALGCVVEVESILPDEEFELEVPCRHAIRRAP